MLLAAGNIPQHPVRQLIIPDIVKTPDPELGSSKTKQQDMGCVKLV
jgi:hypothetical protein